MATSASRVLALLMVAAVGVTLGAVTACTPKPNGPEPTAEQFFAALATGDTAAAAELSDRPADARHALNDAWAGLQATSLDAQILELEVRRGHRQHHLPLHLASAQGPHLDLRRAAEHGPRRGPLGGALERYRRCIPSSARTRRFALRADAPPAGLGERTRRHRRAGARLSVQLRAGRQGRGRRADDDRARRGRRVAAVRQHAGSAAARRAGQLVEAADEPDHACASPTTTGWPPAIGALPGRGHHAAGRTAADRRHVRAGHHQRGQEGGGRRTRRPGRLAGGQRQPERRRRRRAQRGAGRAGAVGDDQPGPGRAGRRAERRQHHRQAGDDRGDQAVHRRDPRRRAERRRRRRRGRSPRRACTRPGRRSR